MSILPIRSRIGRYFWIAVGWVIFGAANGIQIMTCMRPAGMQYASLFWSRTLSWSYWALATPAVLVLARRFPLNRRTAFLAASIHFAAFTAITLLHSAWGTFLDMRFQPWGPGSDPPSWAAALNGVWLATLQFDLIIYIAAVAVTQSIHSRRELAKRELEAERVNALLWQAQVIGLRHQLE